MVANVSDEEMQEHYDNFFEDVFVELEDKYGEIEEMNVCDNLGDHLVGNVYIKFRREEDAERAAKELNNRWFGGRPVYAELSPVTDFREACCRQYEMGECTRSGFCNFMHLKPISRELRRYLYSRRRGRSRSRSKSRGRRSRLVAINWAHQTFLFVLSISADLPRIAEEAVKEEEEAVATKVVVVVADNVALEKETTTVGVATNLHQAPRIICKTYWLTLWFTKSSMERIFSWRYKLFVTMIDQLKIIGTRTEQSLLQ